MMPSMRTARTCSTLTPDKTTAAPRAAVGQLSRLRLLLEAAGDPVGRLHAVRRVDHRRRVALDVGHRHLALDLLAHAVDGLGDRLVAGADRHLDLARRALEGEALEG